MTSPTFTIRQTMTFIEENMNVLLHRQACPFCRARDGRSPGTKLRDIRAGGSKTDGYLKETVKRGLEIMMHYTR